MKEIYIVTTGSHDDYAIDKIFDSLELAEAYVASFKPWRFASFRISKREINKFEAEIMLGFKPYFVKVLKNGKVLEVEHAEHPHGFTDAPASVEFYNHGNGKTDILVHIFAESKKDAIEKTQKIREAILEAGTWMQK